MTCESCDHRETCQKPCDAVNKILWENNRVMEKQYHDFSICFPKNEEVHFSEITEQQIDEFSENDVVPWASGNYRLRQTEVFVERFFNKTPCKEIAERFDVKENTVVCMYAMAVKQLKNIVEALDARRTGVKALAPDKFNEEQKWFLLNTVFGFTQNEIAEMFGKNRNVVGKRVKRMSDKYSELFQEKAMSP